MAHNNWFAPHAYLFDVKVEIPNQPPNPIAKLNDNISEELLRLLDQHL